MNVGCEVYGYYTLYDLNLYTENDYYDLNGELLRNTETCVYIGVSETQEVTLKEGLNVITCKVDAFDEDAVCSVGVFRGKNKHQIDRELDGFGRIMGICTIKLLQLII